MGLLEDFVERHRSRPWPFTYDSPETPSAPAQALYDVYRAEGEAEDRRILTINEWSARVLEAGFTRDKIESGHAYYGLTIRTREERARAGVIGPALRALRQREWGEHMARAHPDGNDYPGPGCGHELPKEIEQRLLAEAAPDEAAIAAQIERDYGAYLRWRPGDPDPRDATLSPAELAETLRVRAVLDAWGRTLTPSADPDQW